MIFLFHFPRQLLRCLAKLSSIYFLECSGKFHDYDVLMFTEIACNPLEGKGK